MIKAIILALLFVISYRPVYADEDFLVGAEVTYEVSESSSAKVTQEITITNTRTDFHATDYTISLRGSDVGDVRAYSGENEYRTVVDKEDGTQIKVLFDDLVAGEGSTRMFTVEYFDSSTVKKSGDVFEITIPKLNQDNFSSYLIKLRVPRSFGKEAYVSPAPDNILETEGYKTYYFEKDNVSFTGVTAAFGEFQVLSFDLTYHLQNPLAWHTKMEIAIPPDTPYQKVYYESLNPKPKNLYIDTDGNWIAIYELSARERLDVRAIGFARVLAVPTEMPQYPQANENHLEPSEFWEVDDPEIKKIAEGLRTPKEIYDYVVSKLSYNYGRVSTGVVRLGALGALADPTNATCTEFTDLFVTLARAAGIPAREINGYAYTDNSTLRPLSLVADVLHAWPEYWDAEKRVWVSVDPTWANTTGGVDYFSKLDMRHLTFVSHGISPTHPISPGSYKLGANPQKDVFVSFGTLPQNTEGEVLVNVSQRASLPFHGLVLVAQIENPGPNALYNQKVELVYDNSTIYENEVPVLLPYEKKVLEFTIPYGFFGSATPERAILFVGKNSTSFNTNKNPALVRDIATSLAAFAFLALGIFLYIKRKRK